VLFKPGMWKWKRLNFGGSRSTLKKEAGSELGSIRLFEEPEAAEVFFIKHRAGMWKQKRLNFCGSGSKNILLLPHPWFKL